MRDRKKWFEKFGKPYYVLWYVEKGYIPTVEEAVERLEHVQIHVATMHLTLGVFFHDRICDV